MSLRTDDARVLEVVSDADWLTAGDIVNRVHMHTGNAWYALKRLAADGVIDSRAEPRKPGQLGRTRILYRRRGQEQAA